jgi:hypothetical protein
LTSIFRDFTNFSKKSLASSVPVIWKFLNQNLPLYIWTVVYDIPLDFIDDNLNLIDQSLLTDKTNAASRLAGQLKTGAEANPTAPTKKYKWVGFELENETGLDNEIEMIAYQLIELVGTLVSRNALREALKVGVYPLTNAIAYYMLMTHFDVQTTCRRCTLMLI